MTDINVIISELSDINLFLGLVMTKFLNAENECHIKVEFIRI